jgi:hypothetical protein
MKIIIIGNGFDLNLGLKTSYKDFMESGYFISLVEKNNSLATYLNKNNQSINWVDIEKELTEYSMAVTVVYQGSINVKNDFQVFKTALMDYLREAQDGEINQNSKAFEMIKNEIDTANIIFNFNYTNSVFKVAKLLGIDNIESKHSHVHGSVETQDIIFGVEDKAEVVQNHTFLKKSYNRNFGKSDIGNYLTHDNDLVLFGHSLGVTDSSYFKNYILSLTLKSRRSELIFYHYGDTGYDEMINLIYDYTLNNLTDLKNYNDFKVIDSSVEEKAEN